MTTRQPPRVLPGLIALVAVVLTSCASGSATGAVSVIIGSADTNTQFQVEVADTVEEQRTGVSGRQALPVGTGMLFSFETRRTQQVWMAGTSFPLDIAWIADGRVIATDTLSPCTRADQAQCPRWTSPEPVDALLEVPAGSLDAVRRGMTVSVVDEQR